MSKKKVRAGHHGFLMKIIEEANKHLQDGYLTVEKTEQLKWKASLGEQLQEIVLPDEEILAELVADEKVTEEEVADEIERSGRLRADATQVLAAIEERLTEQPPPPPASQVAPQYVNSNQSYQPISSQQKTVRAKLPKLEVKKFNGKLCEWQEFWDSFESAIHMNDGLSNVDKFSYLGSLLLGLAKSAVGGFGLTSANYESAIELLKKHCGKKVAIQRALISKLLTARPMFNESDMPRLHSLYDFTEMKYRALQALAVEQSYSEVVMLTLLEKIPDAIRLTITRGRKYLELTLGDTLEALLVEVELREDQLSGTAQIKRGEKGSCHLQCAVCRRGGPKMRILPGESPTRRL